MSPPLIISHAEIDQLVDLGVADDERRAHDDGVAHGAHHQAVLDAEVADHQARGPLLLAEPRVGPLARDDLDAADQAERARLAHQRVIGKRGERPGEIGAHIAPHPLHQVFALHDLDVLQGHGRGGRVAGIGVAVGEVLAGPAQGLDDGA